MTTPAQIAANQQNAEASTGPRTESGKHRAAKNAIKTGLFATPSNSIRPEETEIWSNFITSFDDHLAPEGPVEIALAAEITSAAWRLRRCNIIESALDPEGDPENQTKQNAIDRARTTAQRHFHRNLAELKRHQTERQFRDEYFPENMDQSELGLASVREIIPALQKITRVDPVQREIIAFDALKRAASDPNWLRSANLANPANLPKSEQQTPRNAQCTCGSGTKYKRCCGTNAPAVLGQANCHGA